MQTQASNALHNAIMEAGGKDRPPMLAPGIDNDIYSTVDACPNACKMWKAIERFYKMMNELVRNQCDVTNHQVNVLFLLQLQPEWQRELPEQPKSINDTYLEEQGDTNITIDSLDMSTNGEMVDQDDNDLARERDLLASLIEKLKCKIDDNKNRNKFLGIIKQGFI
uniref:Uncharacterized protein n=1 Tax=Tanacetum cinerariifolium TaxID=118510 RepID=A0A699I6Z5_TANCI|nr:hypothetical protein [Tanacetum cinerariifolium]